MNNNLFEFNHDIKEKIRGWAKNILSEIKSALSLGTDSSEIRNQVGKYIADDTASGLYENSKEVVEAFSKMLEKLNYQKELNLISEDEYYVKLENLRDRYFSKGTQNWVKYTAQIYEYQQKALAEEKKNIVSLYDDISEYASQKIGEVINKQANFAESIKNTGKLFNKNTVNFGDKTVTYYSMRNMQEDIDKIKEYSGLLSEFSARADSLGISEDIKTDFLKKLRDVDFDVAIGLLNSIKGSTNKDVVDYLSAWNERNTLADAFAAKSFETDFSESIDESYEHMKEVLTKAGYEIPDGFFVSGSLSAQKFGDAFIAEIETQMQRIRAVIEAFNSEIASGSQIASGNTYNTSNTSYNIQTQDSSDTVEQIRRIETVKRLSGVA
ncbi:MAG: hypothetical protein IK057_06570 [Clostridia bacterium]|nr:hypothetical protein [Clostridia bacterium]